MSARREAPRRVAIFFLLTLVWTGVFALVNTFTPPKKAPILRKISVKEVSGDVLAWLPWASDWQKVTPETVLWESTLVQVRPNASLVFLLDSKEGFEGLHADTVEITLKTPTVTRLDSGVLRKVALNNMFIPQLPELNEQKEPVEMVYRQLNEAWDRFAALVLPNQVKQSSLDNAMRDPTQEDASVKAKTRKIRIFTPKNEMMALSDHFPVELTILWERLDEPNISYDVMVWKLDEPRRPPLAVTRFDYHYAKLFSEGTYYVQVATSDGRYQSNVHQVHVSLPLAGRKSDSGAASKKPNTPLALNLPPNHFVYRTRTSPATVTFSWERALGKREQRYHVVLTDLSGKELMRKVTTDRLLRLKIAKPGNYRWYIESEPDQISARNTTKSVFSEVRQLTIENPEPGKVDLYTDWLAKKHEGLLYAEDP